MLFTLSYLLFVFCSCVVHDCSLLVHCCVLSCSHALVSLGVLRGRALGHSNFGVGLLLIGSADSAPPGAARASCCLDPHLMMRSAVSPRLKASLVPALVIEAAAHRGDSATVAEEERARSDMHLACRRRPVRTPRCCAGRVTSQRKTLWNFCRALFGVVPSLKKYRRSYHEASARLSVRRARFDRRRRMTERVDGCRSVYLSDCISHF